MFILKIMSLQPSWREDDGNKIIIIRTYNQVTR